MDKKKSGSYYTPARLADLVADYCLLKIPSQPQLSVMEPSVGDGSFIEAIKKSQHLKKFRKVALTVVEKNGEELGKALSIELTKRISITPNHLDYLDFHFQDDQTYDLYIGNPPYVRKNHLTKEQVALAKEIHVEKRLSTGSIKNIWTSFVVSGMSKLRANGIMALILPLELLQVKFTEEIRSLLKREFSRLEIFTFNDLQFQECKGQDTVLLIGYKQHLFPGTFYTNIVELSDLAVGSFSFNQNIAIFDVEKKWTHHFLSPKEYNFLEGIKRRLSPVSNYVNHKPGIVTAANKYFIVNTETLAAYQLEEYAKPILQKGYFVNGSLTFSSLDHQGLIKNKKPAYLLDFNPIKPNEITESIQRYIDLGVKAELPLGYKCKRRNVWYKIPNISDAPEAFFFKRAHDYPKLIRNDAEVLVTDSAYKIEMRPGFNLESFMYSFYNSLTLAFAELEGRYYGGGVLELTPNEFRTLPIPYTRCEDFEAYKIAFENKKAIENILEQNNHNILNGILGLTQEEIDEIELIRQKLVNKRQRNWRSK